eukprot:CAMPEP_0202960712 /NCGR_PEP_ID=MMETSP1396-20130829/4869_1 /ASSEMBLY_ACC=CAM_ASM_000872 /TAXON_ID= /ORGANISM="Pseudokeronopsis sp., Strain Brazil" /LENGTH=80 /DNA_ID=CAMNT_0049680111 /DNA_START=601 /DNA_END=843 /DNA_ORIENTATION=-
MAFMKKCKENLSDEALIVVKENVNDKGFLLDKDDNSVLRDNRYFMEMFDQAGFSVIKHQYQKGFPKDLYKISIFVLRPKD